MIEFKKIGIIGGGIMGCGIAQTAAQIGLNIIIEEKSAETIKTAEENLTEELNLEIEKWGITESDKRVILSRIRFSSDFNELQDVDIIIETVPEIFDLKIKIFNEIEKIIKEEIIIATNTATLSITDLSTKLQNPERLIGMHFHYPVPKRPLVEIVRGLKTSDRTFKISEILSKLLKKEPVEVFEYPGYITTRGILPFLNEAMHIVMEGVANISDVDKAMKLGYDLRVGPLELADQMGLDTVLFWMEHLFKELGEARFRPCPLIRKMVRNGKLGVKSDEGFYKYSNGKKVGKK